MTGPRVLVVGDVMTDVAVHVDHPLHLGSDTPARIAVHPGGAGANVAHWLAAFGARAVFVGAVGDDAFGVDARRVLEAAGVEAHLTTVPGAATGTCVVLVAADGERTMLPDQGANAHLALPAPLPEARHLHVSGYGLLNPDSRAVGVQALDAARAAGMTVSVDAASAGPLAALGGEDFLRLVDGADLLFVTRDETEVLVGSPAPDVAMPLLARHVRAVVMKLGSHGAAHLVSGDAMPTRVPAARPAGPVVDTTGAGDAFAAAFLRAWCGGTEPAPALRAACTAGATAVTMRGARPI